MRDLDVPQDAGTRSSGGDIGFLLAYALTPFVAGLHKPGGAVPRRCAGCPLVYVNSCVHYPRGVTVLGLPHPPFAARQRSLPLPAHAAVLDVASRLFDSDPRAAAGWLIARGAGIAVAAAQRPTSTGPFPPPHRPRIAGGHRSAHGPHGREDDGTGTAAPSGDELRTMREALGLSQLEVAARTNLSRGTVAEVERGRRLNAETLAGLTRSA